MDTVGPEAKVAGPDRVMERHLLGLGVLVLTVSAGYMLTGVSSAKPATLAPQAAQRAESTDAATPAEEESDSPDGIDAHIKKVAAQYGMSADLVAAVIEAESEFNPRAVSRKGARGLMQLMPKTAATLG